MANKLRGEVEIELAGEKWDLRPTFEALSNIESKLLKSIPDIVQELRRGDIRFMTAAIIIWEGLIGANGGRPPLSKTRSGKSLRYEEVGEMIVSDGLVRVVAHENIVLFLLHGLAGDQKMSEARVKESLDEPVKEEDPMKRAE